MMDEVPVKTDPGVQTSTPCVCTGLTWNPVEQHFHVWRCVHLRWSMSKGSSERIARVSLGWVSFKSKETEMCFQKCLEIPAASISLQYGVRIFSLNIETNFWLVGSHWVLFSLGRCSRHIKSWSLGLFYIFNVGVVGFISPPLCAEHIL